MTSSRRRARVVGMPASCHTNESTALDIAGSRRGQWWHEQRAVLSHSPGGCREPADRTTPTPTPSADPRATWPRRPDGRVVGRRRALADRPRHQPVRLSGAGRARPEVRRAAQQRRSTCSSSTASATSWRPRGNTQWVRNARAAGVGELQLGKRVEAVELVELPADQRVPVLRVYLTKWGWEVGRFVEGLSQEVHRRRDRRGRARDAGLPRPHRRLTRVGCRNGCPGNHRAPNSTRSG